MTLAHAAGARWRRLRDRRIFGVRGLGPALLATAVFVFVVAIIALIGVIHAVHIEHRLTTLNENVTSAQNQAEDGQLGAAQQTLATAEVSLNSVQKSLSSSPDLRMLRLLPIARQNLEATSQAVHLAVNLLADGQDVIEAASFVRSPSGHLEVTLKAGQAPTQAITTVHTVLNAVLPGLPKSPKPPKFPFLIGRVRHGVQKVYTEAYKRQVELTSVNDGLGLMNELTGGTGQRRYLIAVANSAEMRGAGGMILSYGVLNADNGKVSLGAFGNIDQLALKQPAPKQFPADYQQSFAGYQSNFLWRNSTVMSDFTVDGPVLQSMYTAATGLPCNGVIQIDPAGLAALLAGIGPIGDPNLGVVNATNVVPLTLNNAYVQFPDRTYRQGYLAGVAKEAFQALTTRPIGSLRPLGTALVKAAAERHVLVYSSTPGIEADIARLNDTGGMPGPGVAFDQVTIQNLGADKMDYYLHSTVRISGTAPSAKQGGSVTAKITLDNRAPPNGRPPYVFGPFNPASGDPPGLYQGLVTIYAPAGSTVPGFTYGAHAKLLFVNHQNGLTAATYRVSVPAGKSDTTTIRLKLPPDPKSPGRWIVVPTPRVYATETYVNLGS